MARNPTGNEIPEAAAARTRRRLFRWAGAAIGLAAAETVAHTTPARAANGGSMILGVTNTASSATSVDTSQASATALVVTASIAGSPALSATNGSTGGGMAALVGTGVAVQGQAVGGGTGVAGAGTGGGVGVSGFSDTHWGVWATSQTDTALQAGSGTGVGVVATSHSATGVYGQAGSTNGFALTHDGVRGFTDSAAGSGVRGENHGGGAGVTGSAASAAGVGVRAENTHGGTALSVAGRSVFTRSGKVSITHPANSATVSVPGGLGASALVLALLQNQVAGVYVSSAVPHSSTAKVTIYLNKAPGSGASPKTAHVAWFVIN